MTRSQWILGTLVCAFSTMVHGESGPVPPPNIIVVLADDMGYSDAGCFGGALNTPALDRLAQEGIRFTHCYNAGMCVISRASLLTGKWWPRALPSFAQSRLLPEYLKECGYRTALIGKWHEEGHPMDHGFDHFFGFLNGFADHFAGNTQYCLDRDVFTDFGPDYYSTEAFTDRAIAFVEQKGDSPFFLYLAFQAPHNPLQAPEPAIMKHRGKYLQGWQAIREARFERQKELGIVAADAQLPDYPENLPGWDTLSDAQRDLEDLRMSVYAAMVEDIDQGIGRLMHALEKSGQAANTLIVFLSDNGTDTFSVMDEPLLKQGKLPGDPGSNYQPGTGWAYATVTPWRLYKISQHNGGVATGAIVWWSGASGKMGRVEHSPVHFVDLWPTFAELAHGPQAGAEIDGESFLPLLNGQPWERARPLYFQYMDNRAIRSGAWTLAEVDGAGWELFNSRRDPMENTDLSGQYPERVAALNGQWLEWWKAAGNESSYMPKSTGNHPDYKPQGDRGSGSMYVPSAMPAALAKRFPVPCREESDAASMDAAR